MATKRRKIKYHSCKHGKLKKPVKTKSGKRKCRKHKKRSRKHKKRSRKHRMDRSKSKPLKRLISGARRSDLSNNTKNKSRITAEAIIKKNKEIQRLQQELELLKYKEAQINTTSFNDFGIP